MDINFPPDVLAKKSFLITAGMAVAFIGAAYYFAISQPLDDDHQRRDQERALEAQGAHADEPGAAHAPQAELPQGKTPSGEHRMSVTEQRGEPAVRKPTHPGDAERPPAHGAEDGHD